MAPLRESMVEGAEIMKGVESLDDFRREVAKITAEQKAIEPLYHKWICALTGLKNAHDLRTLLFMAYYFGSLYWLWNWEKLMAASIGGSSPLGWVRKPDTNVTFKRPPPG